MQVQITFTTGGSSSTFGNFAPGDTLRCSAEEARHFVESARCARYAQHAPLAGDRLAGTVQTPATDKQPAEAPRPAAKRARRATGA